MDSRMYSKLRSLLYDSFKKMALEDIYSVHQLKMERAYVYCCLLAVCL